MFGGLDKLPKPLADHLDEQFADSPEPENDKKAYLNTLFLQDRFHKGFDEIADNKDFYREQYAKQTGDPRILDENGLYAEAGRVLNGEHDEKTMLGEMYGEMLGRSASETPDAKTAVGVQIAALKDKPGFRQDHLDLYTQYASQIQDEITKEGDAHRVTIDAVKNMLTSGMYPGIFGGQNIHSEAWNKGLQALMETAPDDREKILWLASRELPKKKELSGPEKVTHAIGQAADTMAEQVREFGSKQLAKLTTPVREETPGSYFGPISDQRNEPGYKQDRERYQVERMVTDMIAGKVDPLKSSNWVGHMAISAARGVPTILASMTSAGIPILAASIQQQQVDLFKSRGMSDETAERLGTLTAIPETALMWFNGKMIAGRVPGFNAMMAGLKSTSARLAATASTEALGLAASTTAQQVTPDILQQLASYGTKAVPGIGWKKIGEDYAKAAPETLLQMVPYWLMGSGLAHFRDEGYAREMLNKPLHLKAAGFTDETIAKVQDASTVEAKEQALQDGMPKREFGPANQAAIEAVDIGPRSEHISTGTGIETPAETAMLEEWRKNIAQEKSDLERYHEVGREQMRLIEEARSAGKMFEDSPEYQALAKEREEIKNRNGGMPPGQPAARATMHEDGTFTVQKPDTGEIIGQTNTPEMAAKLIEDHQNRSPAEEAAEQLSGMEPTEKQAGAMESMMQEAGAMGVAPKGMTKAMEAIRDRIEGVRQSAKEIAAEFRGLPKLTVFKNIINDWGGLRQIAAGEAAKFVKQIMKVAPKRETRAAIANYLDAGGNEDALRYAAQNTTKLELKKGYEAALKLTPEQKQLADVIRTYFDKSFAKAQQAGLMSDEDFRQNYVTQIVEHPFVGGGLKSEFSNKLGQSFKFSQERTFPNFMELEQAGFSAKTKDIAEIVAIYDTALNKAVLTRRMVGRLLNEQDANGPLAVRFIKGKLPEGLEMDYESVDHPALRGVALRTDIASHMRNILGKSAIREWYDQPGSAVGLLGKGTAKAVDKLNRGFANNMLSGISLFHGVHETKRFTTSALPGGHLDEFSLKSPNPSDPELQFHVRHGLQIFGDTDAIAQVQEGFGHKALIYKVPAIGQASKAITEFTFHELIPRYKFATQKLLYARALDTFKSELASGEMTKSDVAYAVSHVVNARFGHLNLVDLGRNPTMQHIAQMVALAPDFWESNIRNYGQVLQGLAGAKQGRAALSAFLVTAGGIWMVARVLNKAVNDDGDAHYEEPFAVVHNGRIYTMRNEVGDLWNMGRGFANSFKQGGRNTYIAGRLSPVAGSMVDYFSGTNWRGEKMSTPAVVGDFLTKVIPLSLRWAPGAQWVSEKLSPTERARNVSPFEEFISSSMGVQIQRHSTISNAYKIVDSWKDKNPDPNERVGGVQPVSRFQQLRYALEDRDFDKALEEIKKLKGDTSNTKFVHEVKSSLIHSWTGSKARDLAFKASLSNKDRLTVDTAEAMKQTMYQEFLALLGGKPEEAKKVYQQFEQQQKSGRNIQTSFREPQQ